MVAKINLLGERFGRLRVVAAATNDSRGQARWHCACDCGGGKLVRAKSLRCGATRSCGCLEIENRIQCVTDHGGTLTHPAEHAIWSGIKQRCLNPKSKFYHRYGGRGITICRDWLHSFPAFLAHVGNRPTAQHTIDRIDNDRGYEPGNVRWATRSTQVRNRNYHAFAKKLVAHDGVRMTIAEYAAATGKSIQRVRYERWRDKRRVTTISHGRAAHGVH